MSSSAGFVMLAKHLELALDWRLFLLLILNFPLYCWMGRMVFGSYQSFFDAFPYVRGELRDRRSGISISDALIVQPDYPGHSPWLLLLCTVVYFAVSGVEYWLVRAWFGPLA
jgi:hypothetical protein